MRIASHLEQIRAPEQAEGCGCAHTHSHLHVSMQLGRSLLGLVFILNSFLFDWSFPENSSVADVSAMIGSLILGAPIVWVAFKNLGRGALNTSALVALAVLALFASAHYQEAGIVAFFMLLGQIIETRTAEGALASIHSLIKLTPTKARRMVGPQEEEVPVQELVVGDVIRLRPGDHVAADGMVVSGHGSFNEANITGESLPVDKGAGDEVFAGTVNLTGLLEVRVSKAGEDTTLNRVRDLILAAEKTKLPITRIIDQYMSYYTPLILVIGTMVWAFTHDLNRVVTVFIVACPCAFVLATPTALVAALSAGARLGVLIKNVADLESAGRVNAFVFDKTGTLTEGRLVVSRLTPLDGVAPAELLQMAASVEQFSNHPTAKALVQLAGEAGVPLLEPADFAETAGRGVVGLLDGARVVVGRQQWLEDNGADTRFVQAVDLGDTRGLSLIFVARNGGCLGWMGLQDQTRAEAKEALAALKAAGVRRISLVSGDRRAVADRVGQEVGCDDIAGDCLPQHKVDYVRRIRDLGYRVAVVGDGVNDAPALAAGDLGIAMGAAGSEVAIHSATIALMNNDLRRIPFLVELSRAARRVISQNFLIGLAFVIGGMVLGTLSIIDPIVAALFHVTGSLLVVFNSFRLLRQGENLEPLESESAAVDFPAVAATGSIPAECGLAHT
jgi:Cd2+/Zn2+-exporting ATPase